VAFVSEPCVAPQGLDVVLVTAFWPRCVFNQTSEEAMIRPVQTIKHQYLPCWLKGNSTLNCALDDDDIRDLIKLVFSSNLHNVSKLNPVHQPRWKIGQHPSTSWIAHRYWIPPLRVELPIWVYFEEQFKHILKGKKESNRLIPYYKEAKSFEDLKKDARTTPNCPRRY
jgi:hypothetical protein